jgi:hypothetical protein
MISYLFNYWTVPDIIIIWHSCQELVLEYVLKSSIFWAAALHSFASKNSS